MYFFHSLENPFSCSDREGDLGIASAASTVSKLLLSGTPVVVLERGRGREGVCCKSGVVGELLVGDGSLGDRLGEAATVWYVRTGRRSTTDLGALHRRRRIRARRMSMA